MLKIRLKTVLDVSNDITKWLFWVKSLMGKRIDEKKKSVQKDVFLGQTRAYKVDRQEVKNILKVAQNRVCCSLGYS